jgi:hypothetical protein
MSFFALSLILLSSHPKIEISSGLFERLFYKPTFWFSNLHFQT